MVAAVTDPVHETDVMLTVTWFVFVLIGVYFAGIGCAVLVRRKPLIISSGWFLCFFILLLVPETVSSVMNFVVRIKENASNFLNISMVLFAGMAYVWLELLFFLAFYILFFVFLRIRMREYAVIGASWEAIKDAIYFGLEEMDITCEQTRAWIKLPELGTRVQISMRSFGSEGVITVKDRSQRTFLRKLVKLMRVYFREQKVPTRKIAAIEYLIIGIFCTAFAIYEILFKGWVGIF